MQYLPSLWSYSSFFFSAVLHLESFEEVKKKVRRVKQKQPLAAVNKVPTSTAANAPDGLRDFLRSPRQEMSRARLKLNTHLATLGGDIIMVKKVIAENSPIYIYI